VYKDGEHEFVPEKKQQHEPRPTSPAFLKYLQLKVKKQKGQDFHSIILNLTMKGQEFSLEYCTYTVSTH
jgi:hypothetical protein